MQEHHSVLTPDNLQLDYEVAGLGSRSTAALIDYIIIFFMVTIISVAAFVAAEPLSNFISRSGIPSDMARAARFVLAALVILIGFGSWWGYFMVFELLWNGQTPGKRMLGLRVVDSRGRSLGAMASVIRNLVRLVDMLLLIGVWVMMFDKLSRRLGDFAAGTLVIRLPRQGRLLFQKTQVPDTTSDMLDLLSGRTITAEEYAVARDYFDRSGRLDAKRRDEIAREIAVSIAERLRLPTYTIVDSAHFLSAVIKTYESRHQYAD